MEAYRQDAGRQFNFDWSPPDTDSVLETVASAEAAGFWPVLISAPDERCPAPGKKPVGREWGKRRRPLTGWKAEVRKNPRRNVGLKLGPEGGVIDLDVDDPERAAPVLRRLFPDGLPPTLGWSNADDKFHLIFQYDPRLAAFGKAIIKGEMRDGKLAGNPFYLGLEIRIGVSGNAATQYQSVIPPSLLADGTRRRWNDNSGILPLPESVFRDLDRFGRAEAGHYDREVVLGACRPHFEELAGEWGLRLTERRNGAWAECHAAGREDATPSAGLNLETGVYHDFGVEEDLSFLDLAARLRPAEFPNWQAAAAALGERFGVKPGRKVKHHGNGPLHLGCGHHANGKPELTPPDSGQPHADSAPSARPDAFSNVRREGQGREATRVPLRVAEIDEARRLILGDWPKRVGPRIFVRGEDDRPQYLDSPAQFFALVDRTAQVDWGKGERCISQERYFEHLRMTVPRFDAIEVLPHWPAVPGIYYLHRALPKPTGKHLAGLLHYFRPATELDRSLIQAYILTLFWGGPPGQRPAFLVQGPEHDGQQGRGTGKSTLIDIPAEELAGGYLDVEPTDTMASIKTRLLSGEAIHQRVGRLDNLKMLRLSWGDLEKLITSPVISGHAMYQGEGRRPNLLVWGITLNGANLSKDMAQRCIPIRVARPRYSRHWEALVRGYCAEHRWEIAADALQLLQAEPGDFEAATRWPRWEADVLAKVDDFQKCQALIVERQGSIDDDNQEKALVVEHFRERIKPRRDPDTSVVFIPSRVAARWLEEATGDKRATNKATNYLAGLGIPELRKSSDDGARGWRWTGATSAPGATAENICWDGYENAK